MTIEKKMEIIADILDMDVNELTPETELASLEDWDSVAALSFIAMMDEEFGKAVKGSTIKGFVTIQDALNIME